MATEVTKPPTPRATPKPATPRQGTPRQPTPRNGDVFDLDPRVLQLVWTSLKDRIYQRSNNLRQSYRELDAKGDGLIPIPDFVEEMSRAYQLGPVERQCLGLLLVEADFRKDGVIDFREFVEMLKVHHKPKTAEPATEDGPVQLTVQERRRFERCELDKKMQYAVIRNEGRPINITGSVPTNELGAMHIDSPYGVLGDSERMDAVIASFLNIKHEKLRSIFSRYDVSKTGQINYHDFRLGMKELDPYVFNDEIDDLLVLLDKKKKGFVSIDEFANGLGKEYLKKKAHRSQAHENPFEWPIVDKKPLIAARIKEAARAKHFPPPRLTRAAQLRNVDTQDKLYEGNRSSARGHAIPKPPQKSVVSPRDTKPVSSEPVQLPQIHSAGGSQGPHS